MNVKAGFPVFLVLLLVDLPSILGQKYKVHENSMIPVDLPKLCGDDIIKYYYMICKPVWSKRRHRRDVGADLFVQTKNEAQDFLSFKRRKRSTHKTDVVEECCGERCRTEEIMEYC